MPRLKRRAVRSQARPQHRPVDLQPDDPLSLVASSGTTSARPKICIHTHGGQLGKAAADATTGKPRADDTLVSASPFTHPFGLPSIHLSPVAGGRQALLPHWSPDALVEVADRSGVTVLFRRARATPRSSHAVGMSEVGAGTFTRPVIPAKRSHAASCARFRAQRPASLPMTAGYAPVTSQAVTPTAISPIGGRRSEFINRGGMKFSAVEVENLLSEMPSLAQYAVVGRDDDRLGQRSCLIAVPREGAAVRVQDEIGMSGSEVIA